MSKSRKIDSTDLVSNPDNPFGLPNAFMQGNKLDLITPISTADEAIANLQTTGLAGLRSQLGRVQGTVAGLQQAARESINDQIQPAMRNLGELVDPPIQAITRQLGEAMEYAAGLGVSPAENFSVAENVSRQIPTSEPDFQAGGMRKVKSGEIGTIAELHGLIREGKVSEFSNANGDRSYYWSGSFNSNVSAAGSTASNILSRAKQSVGSKSGGSILSKVQDLGAKVSQAAQQATQLGQQWFQEGGGFDPSGQFGGFAGGITGLGNATQPNVVAPLHPPGGFAPGGQGNPAGGPGGRANDPRPGMGGQWCVLAVSGGGLAPTVFAVGPNGEGLPPGWQIVAGPSQELCGLGKPRDGGQPPQPAAGQPPAGPGQAGVGGLGAAAPGRPDWTLPGQTSTGKTEVCKPCVSDQCTFDIRKGKQEGQRFSDGTNTGSAEGADDATGSRDSKASWRSYSSVSGEGTYTTSPGGVKRNTFDCLLAAGPNKQCVEKVAESVSGIGLDDGKSKSGEQWKQGLGESVSVQICKDYSVATFVDGVPHGKKLTEIIGLRKTDGSSNWGLSKADGNSWKRKATDWIENGINDVLDVTAGIIINAATRQACEDARLYSIYFGKFVYGFASRWLGFQPLAPEVRLTQAENLICTPMLPSPENAIEGWLADKITADEFQCWTEASGIPKRLWEKILASRKNKLSADQLTTLFRRGDIDEKEWKERIRELGWLDDKTSTEIEILTRQYPGMQDIVRFMQRDVVDEKVYVPFDLDSGFEQKYKGDLQTWAKNQGIPDEVALYFWRAHWTIPSPTQLYEMYHRLRHSPQYGPPEVFEETIKSALQQQDIAPFWIDKLLAVSFNPLTRVDVRRAFNLGVVDSEQVLQAYRDIGYSDENANTLLQFSVKARRASWKTLPAVKSAIAGQMSIGEAVESAAQDNVPEEGLIFIRGYIPKQIELLRRKACLSNIKKRYLRGEFDDQQLNDYLAQLPMELDTVGMIAAGWKCEKQTKSKIISASQLCKLYGERIITLQQFQDSLHNLGYTSDDALKLLASCVKGLEVRQKKQLEETAKKQASNEDKVQKAIDRQGKNIDKLAKAQAKRLEALRKARETRSDAIVAAAETLHKKSGDSMVSTMQQVKNLVTRLRNERGMSEDDAIAQMQLAVGGVEKGKPADLWGLAFDLPLPTSDTV